MRCGSSTYFRTAVSPEHGDRHPANRHLFNKLLGQLHHCRHHGQTFDEAKAFPAPLRDAA